MFDRVTETEPPALDGGLRDTGGAAAWALTWGFDGLSGRTGLTGAFFRRAISWGDKPSGVFCCGSPLYKGAGRR